jgi:DNA-binding beta-propeller fold protein YncE
MYNNVHASSVLRFISCTCVGAMLGACIPLPPDGGDPPAGKPVITTVIGNGLAGDNGDGLSGTETALYLVQDVTVGPDGDLYFVDWNNHKIRRLADGVVETIAGTGELGAADDGYGPEIQFNHPTNLAFDSNGDLIIAAWHNSLVKRMNLATGYAVTIAGTGARSFNGDDIPGTEAFLDLPSSVAFDPGTGNILISDQANFRIRLLEPNGVIHTICGDGIPEYYGDGIRAEEARINSAKGQAAAPAGRLTLTAQGEIIIADTGNHVVRRINGAGIISLVAGTPGLAGYAGDGGPATAAMLSTPSDVAVLPDGSIIVADTMNHAVRVIAPDGTISTLAGTGQRGFDGDGGPADEALLDRPYGVTVGPDGTVYVADTHNHRIRRIASTLPDDYDPQPPDSGPVDIIPCTGETGSVCTFAGTGQKGSNGDGHDKLQSVFYWPMDIEFAPDGRVIFLDWNNHQVREILPDDTVVTIMGTDFVGDGPRDLSDLTVAGADPLTVDLNHPTDVQIMPDGDILIMAWHNHKLRVLDSVDGRVRVLAGAGAAFAGDGDPAVDVRVNQPRSGVLTPDGDFFFVDQRNQRIRVLYNFAQDRENALAATVVGTGEKGFNGDGLAGLQTQLSFQTGGNPEPSGGITYDPSTQSLYVSDSENQLIRRIDFLNDDFTDSTVMIVAGQPGAAGLIGDGGPATAASLSNPQDLEIGPDGNLYFADVDNDVVRRIDLATGIIERVAGTGERGYAGDGGSALNAQLDRPFGVAFDLSGDLYVSDTFNSRIRKIEMEY